MKTNYLEDFKRHNTDRISWITLMNRNGYIISAIFIIVLAVAGIITGIEHELTFWEYFLFLSILGGALACFIWFGFYQYWKTFNKSYGWRIHTIMKGRHYSSFFRLPWFFKVKQSRIFMFAPECAEATNDDVNKLYRIGFGIFPFKPTTGAKNWKPAHQFDSIGFGWRGNGIGVEILTYTYEKGVRKVELITVVPVAVPFHFDLTNINYKVLYSVNPVNPRIDFNPIDYRSTHQWPEKNFGLKCGFYFGGDEPADRNYQVWEKK